MDEIIKDLDIMNANNSSVGPKTVEKEVDFDDIIKDLDTMNDRLDIKNAKSRSYGPKTVWNK